MPVASVVKYSRAAAGADCRHHVWHHRAKAGPWHHLRRVDLREMLSDPSCQRSDTIGADVAVEAVELCRPRDAKAILAQAAGDDLCRLVQQADLRRSSLALRRLEIDRDRIAFNRANVDAIAEHRRQPAAFNTGADDHAIRVDDGPSLPARAVRTRSLIPMKQYLAIGRRYRFDARIIDELCTLAHAGI